MFLNVLRECFGGKHKSQADGAAHLTVRLAAAYAAEANWTPTPPPPTVRVDRKTCAEGRHAHDQMDSLFVKKKAARAVKKRNTERGTVAFTLKLGKK